MDLGIISVIISAVFIVTANCGNIPSYIHICKRSDPDVAKCIRESVDFLKPRLRDGIKELNVPGLEPLRIPDIDIARGADPNTFKAILKEIDVYGASDFQLTKLKVNIPNLTFRIEVVLPLLRLIGTYDINARVVVPIKGEGKFYANATSCVAKGVLRGELKEVNGQQYMNFTNLDLKLLIGDYNLRLDNLFSGDNVLGQAANGILNDNKKEFIEAATPFIQRRVSGILLDIANQVVKSFAFDELFPEK